MTYYLKYLLIMEFSFDAILHSQFGDKISDEGNIKRSRGAQIPHACPKVRCVSIRPCQVNCCNYL